MGYTCFSREKQVSDTGCPPLPRPLSPAPLPVRGGGSWGSNRGRGFGVGGNSGSEGSLEEEGERGDEEGIRNSPAPLSRCHPVPRGVP